MQQQRISNFTWIPVIILFMSYSLLAGCSNNTDKDDPEELRKEQEQQRELIEERKDTTKQKSPIFETSLKGTDESIDDTEATGSVILTLEGDSIHLEGEFSGLTSDYTESYIHQALQSERVQRLEPTIGSDKTSGTLESSYKLDEGEISMLKKDSLYISIYSTKFESGELRGQLTMKDDEDSTTVRQETN